MDPKNSETTEELVSPASNNGKSVAASSILTMLVHGSAPFLSTFLLVHLSAPIEANIVGSGLASSVMLLGREYYQTAFGERYLLLLPFAVHVTSSVAKRVVLTFISDLDSLARSEKPFSPKPRPRIRKLTSLLSISAYTTLFLFVPIHVATHRLLPAEADTLAWPSTDVDLDPLGSSELDYEFVKTAIKTWPWRSWILYTGIVGCVLVHAAQGASVIYARYIRGRCGCVGLPNRPSLRSSSGNALGLARGNRKTAALAGVAALPVLTGPWMLSREPMLALSSVVQRYQITLMGSWVYRL
ncbi:hypothetical protein M404DRAFT_999729 [Pisolithus tinctorius Marx 270]|uniref:Mitochondrial adapter protein MCP1 transmembrane domain-containing protein n=1 Tax=Pisolithus tinctorius Marx 270 TaxID=870435 RepID=A0A0C3K7K7_PISTI|nr:hypothetical protein M404DRAFT_999729 [Pisolithus tinctorius Marx 270]